MFRGGQVVARPKGSFGLKRVFTFSIANFVLILTVLVVSPENARCSGKRSLL